MRNRQYRTLKFPFKGLDVGRAFDNQPDGTCVDCLNVRGFDPRTGRRRGAQRAGLTRYLNAQAGGSATKIQDINQLITHQTSVTASTTQIQNSNYINLAVANGVLYLFDTSSFTSKGSNFDANAPVIFSAQLFNDVFYADGKNVNYYDGATAAVRSWSTDLTAGSLPGSGTDRARLIEMWRGRIVLSGVRSDPHNWFMSKLGDPFDWNYAPSPETVVQAVAGNNSNAGLIGDVINSMCAYDDDTLIFWGDHTIWQMTGDPAEGGRVDLVSDMTGAAFGRPWCKGPQGEIYFVGSRGGIYRMNVGNKPERISSARIEEKLNQVNLDTTIIRPIYDDRTMTVHFYFTPLTAGATTHYAWDLREEAFWADSFADNNYNPRTVHVMEGDDPNDRVVVIGSDDGRIRYLDYTNKSDDQKAINSYIYFGPFVLDEGRRVQIRDLIGELDLDADGAYYEIYSGNTVQASYPGAEDVDGELFDAASLQFSGSWRPGRNASDHRRGSGRALFMKLGNREFGETWAFERALAYFVSSGTSRMRQEA